MIVKKLSDDDKKLKEYLESANQYVKDLKECPEKRMENVQLLDEIVFLKKDDKDSELWNFGHAQIMGIENSEGIQKNICKVKYAKTIFAKSSSYPFSVYIEPQHILRNYTDEKRRENLKNEDAKV